MSFFEQNRIVLEKKPEKDIGINQECGHWVEEYFAANFLLATFLTSPIGVWVICGE